MSRKRDSVTIIDVAKAAGVSVTTVSRVLNDKDDVAEATYRRVRAVIDELGYSSSLAARSMRSRKTNVIGVIAPDMADSFIVQVVKGVNEAILELEYDLLIYTSGDISRNRSAATDQKYISLLNGSVTDGAILITPASSTITSVSPIVAIDPNFDDPSVPAVIATNFKGSYEIVEYLIGLGHRRIGFIGGRTDVLSGQRRLDGYKQALDDAGIPFEEALETSGNFTFEAGTIGARQLLNQDRPPSAIFAANDQSALGVMKAATSLGLKIPQDLSVVGFDNIPESAYHGLTTVDQFISKMGYNGAKLLHSLIQGKVPENKLAKIATNIVIRNSCRSIR